MGAVCSLKKESSAQSYYEKALKIFESLNGVDCYETLMIHNNIAGMYLSHQEFQKAEESCLKALDILNKSKGKEGLEAATVFKNLFKIKMQ